jgi:hypothetical protein
MYIAIRNCAHEVTEAKNPYYVLPTVGDSGKLVV